MSNAGQNYCGFNDCTFCFVLFFASHHPKRVCVCVSVMQIDCCFLCTYFDCTFVCVCFGLFVCLSFSRRIKIKMWPRPPSPRPPFWHLPLLAPSSSSFRSMVFLTFLLLFFLFRGFLFINSDASQHRLLILFCLASCSFISFFFCAYLCSSSKRRWKQVFAQLQPLSASLALARSLEQLPAAVFVSLHTHTSTLRNTRLQFTFKSRFALFALSWQQQQTRSTALAVCVLNCYSFGGSLALSLSLPAILQYGCIDCSSSPGVASLTPFAAAALSGSPIAGSRSAHCLAASLPLALFAAISVDRQNRMPWETIRFYLYIFSSFFFAASAGVAARVTACCCCCFFFFFSFTSFFFLFLLFVVFLVCCSFASALFLLAAY